MPWYSSTVRGKNPVEFIHYQYNLSSTYNISGSVVDAWSREEKEKKVYRFALFHYYLLTRVTAIFGVQVDGDVISSR